MWGVFFLVSSRSHSAFSKVCSHEIYIKWCNHIFQVLVDLVARGLRWNAIGLDMSRANMTALEKALVHTLYLKHNTHGELHFELDHPLRSKITSSPSMLIPPPPLASSADNVDVGEVTVAASGSANAIEGKIDDRSRSRSSNTAEDGNDALSPTEEELYATLQRDGILQVDNFGLGDEMLEKLSAIATSTMEVRELYIYIYIYIFKYI